MTSQDRFPRLDQRSWGYDPAQVDDFLDRVAAVLHATDARSPTAGHDAAASAPGAGATAVPGCEETGAAAGASSVEGAGTSGAVGESTPATAGSSARVGSRQVRERVFDRGREGYDPAAVDAHLDDLEDELFDREREAFVAEHGVQRWNEHVELLGQLLVGRLNRPRTERFRRPAKHRTAGYSAADVDVLCDRLMEQLRSAPDIDPRLLRGAVFRAAQGQRCYEEQQVDAFLDRAVEFVLAVRGHQTRR
ncbi:DivIVA domain-containing protein [Kocuria tytonicola]|uniref:DivIVA domain-containing protein n=1 Tax=Kocuria tytonicola TaxID=2055946 RepID=A0A3L9L308_9MICC|nr:DivIVA domain-containing protein [Kocuria tytonicola]RLY92359.1 DivIVA domain-containing protein [Kocuria tytonicola]